MRTLDDIRLKDNDRKAIIAAAAILRERFPVDRVILFGSKARGDDTQDSDIDLLVLTSRPVTHREDDEMMGSLYQLQLDLGVLFTPVAVATEEWEHGLYQVLPLRTEIERDGVLA